MIRALLALCILCAACTPQVPQETGQSGSAGASSVRASEAASLPEPLSIYDPSRVTKKPFGIRIVPATSPVQPERFTGYHTGTDFEVLPGEDEERIAVPAICEGKIVTARRVGGYGGVALQACTIGGQNVTVLYGHLDEATLASGTLRAGDIVGFLGEGFSTETDGERPHLHLSVHKGGGAELRGYAQTERELDGWIDPQTLLP